MKRKITVFIGTLALLAATGMASLSSLQSGRGVTSRLMGNVEARRR